MNDSNLIKAVQFKHMIQVSMDGSKEPKMGLHRNDVESITEVGDGDLLFVLKRNLGSMLIPSGNISCVELDLTQEQLNQQTLAATAKEALTQLNAAKDLAERQAKVVADALKPKKRRTINDI